MLARLMTRRVRRDASGRTRRLRPIAGAARRGRRSGAPAAAAAEKRSNGDRRLPGFDPATLSALGLTRREIAVLELVAQGRTNEGIGEALRISPLTVKKHVERMCAKVGAANRAALVAVAWQRSRPAGPSPRGPRGRARPS